MEKGKILIAVPTFENIKPQCFKSIFGLTNPKNFNLYFDYVKGYDCARARNEIAKLAIKHNFDYVLMIDSDVSVPKETVNKLLDCKTDVALGWYYKKRTKTDETVIFDFGKDFTGKNMIYGETLYEREDPFEIKGGGLGISLVNVNVFRKMPYPYFKYVIYDNDTILSEDLYFCNEARKYGMQIKCNPSVKGGHINEVLM
ncbi:hypothetical protein [Methanobrevibacter sp.]|uniref:hypothetical protein n=1 Tax=Methanobrevibacter sp. TaxID=66852 RepID=UPI00389073E4